MSVTDKGTARPIDAFEMRGTMVVRKEKSALYDVCTHSVIVSSYGLGMGVLNLWHRSRHERLCMHCLQGTLVAGMRLCSIRSWISDRSQAEWQLSLHM